MDRDQQELTVTITVHPKLAYLLRDPGETSALTHVFKGSRSVKDLIESLGIPHTEVGTLQINGIFQPFSTIVGPDDRIEIGPVTSLFCPARPANLRAVLSRPARFVLDVHLGTLARRLRMLGFDTDYAPGRDDPELADIACRDQRILLTRDRRLLMRAKVEWGLSVTNTEPYRQTVEVLERLGLWDDIRIFSRCIACNGELYPVRPDSEEQAEVVAALPAGVTCWCADFVRCADCRKIYWEGSHFDKMEVLMARLLHARKT